VVSEESLMCIGGGSDEEQYCAVTPLRHECCFESITQFWSVYNHRDDKHTLAADNCPTSLSFPLKVQGEKGLHHRYV
jgi:hypothetical protein